MQENALAQAASRQIHRKLEEARRNPIGKIYYICNFCAEPVYSQTKWSVPLKTAFLKLEPASRLLVLWVRSDPNSRSDWLSEP